MDTRLVWLKYWLFFCFGLLLIYILVKFFEWFSKVAWLGKIKKKNLLIERTYKFNKKYVNKISCSEMKKIIDDSDFRSLAERPAWFELFKKERIVFFEVPWGEVYCECPDDDYNELVGHIRKKIEAQI